MTEQETLSSMRDLSLDPGFPRSIGNDGLTARYCPTTKTIEIPLRGEHSLIADSHPFPELTGTEQWDFEHESLHYVCDSTTAMQYLFLLNTLSLMAFLKWIPPYHEGKTADSVTLERGVAELFCIEKMIDAWRQRSRVCMEMFAYLKSPRRNELEYRVEALHRKETDGSLAAWEESEKKAAEEFLRLEKKLGESKATTLTTNLLLHALNPGIMQTELNPGVTYYRDARSKLNDPAEVSTESPLSPDERFIQVFIPLCELIATDARRTSFDAMGLAIDTFDAFELPIYRSADAAAFTEAFGEFEDIVLGTADEGDRGFQVRIPTDLIASATNAKQVAGPPFLIFLRSNRPDYILYHEDLSEQDIAGLKMLYVFQHLKTQFIRRILGDREEPIHCPKGMFIDSHLCTEPCEECFFYPLYNGIRRFSEDFEAQGCDLSSVANYFGEYKTALFTTDRIPEEVTFDDSVRS